MNSTYYLLSCPHTICLSSPQARHGLCPGPAPWRQDWRRTGAHVCRPFSLMLLVTTAHCSALLRVTLSHCWCLRLGMVGIMEKTRRTRCKSLCCGNKQNLFLPTAGTWLNKTISGGFVLTITVFMSYWFTFKSTKFEHALIFSFQERLVPLFLHTSVTGEWRWQAAS